ncbi:MAG TPA: DUF1631 family protein [Gammaproteobacteria bacterium]
MSTNNLTPENGKTDNSANKPELSKVISDYLTNDDSGAEQTRSAAAGASRKSCFNRLEVIEALSKLQPIYRAEYVPGRKTNINTDDFKKALLNTMAKQKTGILTKSMNQIDGRTVDFVEMIFGAFLRDHNISDAIKSLLLMLQIPVIKIALLDHKFFYNNKHPARHTLDTIAHIGIGIEDRENTVYKTMQLINEQLLNTFDKNPISFKTAQASLNRLENIEKEKLEQTEKQTQKQIFMEHARHVVLTELQKQIGKTELPKAVHPLILKYWSTLMLHRFVRFGKESKQWIESVDTLHKLIASLQPLKNKADWNYLHNNHMLLVAIASRALEETNQSKEHVYSAIESLKRTYKKILDETQFDNHHHSGETTSNFMELTHRAHNSNKSSSDKDLALAKARQKVDRLPYEVRPGVWFEIFIGANKPIRRLKLSVIIMEEARLVFIDRLGVKVIEKDAAVFAAELASKQSKVIADHSVFDHALGQVISSIAATR